MPEVRHWSHNENGTPVVFLYVQTAVGNYAYRTKGGGNVIEMLNSIAGNLTNQQVEALFEER
jgi:hypothetical protein